MSYKVIHAFTDIQDFNHIYRVGDVYPRSGMCATETRLNELAGSKNKQKRPLIVLNNKTRLEEKQTKVGKEEKTEHTKTEINRMPTAELKELALSVGIKGAGSMTGTELKKQLINLFGL